MHVAPELVIFGALSNVYKLTGMFYVSSYTKTKLVKVSTVTLFWNSTCMDQICNEINILQTVNVIIKVIGCLYHHPVLIIITLFYVALSLCDILMIFLL